MTSKEDCFSEAMEAYQDATGKDLGVQREIPWRQNVDGSWSQEERGFWAAVNSMKKWLLGNGHEGSAVQVRRPDLTVPSSRGPLVVDLKFTRADGTVDTWGTDPGAGNGQTQRHDYNEINRQSNPDAEDMKLDPETCRCDERGAQQEWVADPSLATVPEGQLFFMPLPSPGGILLPSPGGVVVPSPGFGGLIPVFP